MKKILIIEDDKWISASLKLYLENSNYKIELHFDWIDAIEKFRSVKPDLIILDINLPGKDWIQITKEIRKESKVPIVMLTARWSEIDRINWLETWADDYVAKPFSPRELLARINTIIRRVSDSENEKKEVKESIHWIMIDSNKKIAEVNWVNIWLTGIEFDILKKIYEAGWNIVTREIIMTEIIGYDKYLYDRTIDTHIKNIRKKIGKKDVILTVRWEWYRINN